MEGFVLILQAESTKLHTMQNRIRKKLVLALLLTLFSSTWVDARSYVLNYSKPSENGWGPCLWEMEDWV